MLHRGYSCSTDLFQVVANIALTCRLMFLGTALSLVLVLFITSTSFIVFIRNKCYFNFHVYF